MTVPDYAKTVKTAMATSWSSAHPDWSATLEVDDDYTPAEGHPVVLVADDTGPVLINGAWVAQVSPRRPTLRLTGYADGRTEAINAVNAAAAFVVANKPGIARIESIGMPLVTRDRSTGADLASVLIVCIVRSI